MKKPPVIIGLSVVIFFIASSCTSRQSVSAPNISASVGSESSLRAQCSPLQLDSGSYIFTAEDAAKIRGGAWKVGSELFIDPEVDWLHCAYALYGPSASQIIVQTVTSAQFPNDAPDATPVFGLGDRAAFKHNADETQTLTVQKREKVINIVCRQDSKTTCTAEDYQKIASSIVSRWF